MAHTPDDSASVWQFRRNSAKVIMEGNETVDPIRLVDYLQGTARLEDHFGFHVTPLEVDRLPLSVPRHETLCSACHVFLDTLLRRDLSDSSIWTSIMAHTFCYAPLSRNHDAFERSARFLGCRLCHFFARVSAERLNKTRSSASGPPVWGTWTLQPAMIAHDVPEPFVFYYGGLAWWRMGLGCGPPNVEVYLAPSWHPDRDSGYAGSPGLQIKKSGGSSGGKEFVELRRAPPLVFCSSEVTKLIKQWHQECLSTHTYCGRLLLTAEQRPRRLLLVSRGDDSTFRVRLSEDVADKTYLALSYAWGHTLPLTTTKENLSAFLVDIPLESMPKTLREATILTHDLGYEFIWIDALCIVQDDPGDWAVEGAKMHWIYQGAILTLSAAASDNCASGLFPDRSSIVRSEPIDVELGAPEAAHHTSAEVEKATGGSPPVKETTPKPPPAPQAPQNLSVVLQFEGHERLPPHIRARGYLSTRGWILQERILAPALVHFAATDTVWECRQHCVSETGDRSDAVDRFFKGVRTISAGGMEQGGGDEQTWHRRWLNSVVNYSERELTYPEDKLPAVGGLARYVRAEGLESRYLAGHWVDKWFAEGLTWYRDKRDVVPTPEGVYIAPSWSWASIIGRVKFTYTLTNFNDASKKVLRPTCTLKGWVAPAEQAHLWTSGDESVYGRLPCPVGIEVSGILFPQLPSSHVDMDAAEAIARLVDPSESNSFAWKTGHEEDPGEPAWCFHWDGADGIPEEWFLFYIALEAKNSWKGGADTIWHLLVLKRRAARIAEGGEVMEGEDVQDFERIGKAECTVHKVARENFRAYIPRSLEGCPAERVLRIW